MYGGDSVSNHMNLSYGLLRELFKTFKGVKYSQISIPLTLISPFHQHIENLVVRHLNNPGAVFEKIQNIKSIKEPQQISELIDRFPVHSKVLPHDGYILMPATFLPYALKMLRKEKVLVVVSSELDVKILSKSKLPTNFRVYNFYRILRQTIIPKPIYHEVERQAAGIFKRNSKHFLFGSNRFQKWFIDSARSSTKMIFILERLFLNYKIKSILTINPTRQPDNILSLMARKYGIPCIWIQYWLLTDKSMFPSWVSHYFVWGNHFKNWLIQRGVPEEKIIITGNFSFESIARSPKLLRKEYNRVLGIPDNHLTVGFVVQIFDHFSRNEAILKWVQDAINNKPITLVIISRVRDNTNYGPFLAKRSIVLAPTSINLYESLINTDFFMTVSSTSAIEAALFQKGIIVVQPSLPYDYLKNYNNYHKHLEKAQAGVVVRNADDMNRILQTLLINSEKRNSLIEQGQQFLAQSLDLTVRPSERITRLLRELTPCKK